MRVVVRLRGVEAQVAQKRRWHRSQRLLRVLAPQEVEVELHVSNTPGLVRRVLACGQDAEVLKPLSLRQEVLAHARAIAARG